MDKSSEYNELKELSLLEISQLIWNRRKLITILVVGAALLMAVISLVLPNWYKSTAVIMPPTKKQFSFGGAGLLSQIGFGGLLGGSQSTDRFMAILQSRSLMEQVIRKFDLQEKYDVDTMEKALKAMKNNYHVDVGEEDQIIIEFWDKDQEKVAEITNYILFCLDSLNIAQNTNDATYSRDFIESRLQLVLDSLLYLEKEIGTFMKSEGVLNLEEQVKEGISAAAEIKLRILAKEVELAVAEKSLNSDNPTILRIKYELMSLRSKYHEIFAGKDKNRLFPGFESVPELELKFTRLRRKADYFLKLLEFLAPQYEQAKIEAVKSIPTIQVLDYAARPDKKDRPRRTKMVLISVIIAFGVGTLYAYFRGRWELMQKR